ncbi:hypothetical protein LZ32DRAFT_104870 [Colletotrichum eremochloae]|nr:hypothetical protein LZ32DRAFT_104870 [Colletotrichum eremochloae]
MPGVSMSWVSIILVTCRVIFGLAEVTTVPGQSVQEFGTAEKRDEGEVLLHEDVGREEVESHWTSLVSSELVPSRAVTIWGARPAGCLARMSTASATG